MVNYVLPFYGSSYYIVSTSVAFFKLKFGSSFSLGGFDKQCTQPTVRLCAPFWIAYQSLYFLKNLLGYHGSN